jgi:Uncharacterized protein conserved in bacteria (DUF2188)
MPLTTPVFPGPFYLVLGSAQDPVNQNVTEHVYPTREKALAAVRERAKRQPGSAFVMMKVESDTSCVLPEVYEEVVAP